MRKTKIYDFAKYASNPYTDRFARKMLIDNRQRKKKFIQKSGMSIISKEGKEIEKINDSDLIIGYEETVDREQFVKIYVGSLMLFNELSKKAALLFTFILRSLPRDKTFVYMIPAEFTVLMKCSDATYYRAVVELLDAEMLARSDKSALIYFINPAFVFNGDRMPIVRSFVKGKQMSDSVGDSDANVIMGSLPPIDEYSKAGELGDEVISAKKNDDIAANEGFDTPGEASVVEGPDQE